MNTSNVIDLAILGTLSSLVVIGVVTLGMGSALIVGSMGAAVYTATSL